MIRGSVSVYSQDFTANQKTTYNIVDCRIINQSTMIHASQLPPHCHHLWSSKLLEFDETNKHPTPLPLWELWGT